MSIKPLIRPTYRQFHDREDDTVYFSTNSSRDSWAGHMDDEDNMPEEAVTEYIKDRNPKLFLKLHGLPVASSEIPMSFHGQRVLRRLEQNEAASGSHQEYSDQSPSLAVQPASKHTQTTSIRNHPERSYAESLTIKAKVRIEYKLRNGFVLYQRQLSPVDAPLPCDFALCIGRLLNIAKLQYYVVEYDHASDISSKVLVSKTTEYYCDECFDTIFATDGQENIPPVATNGQNRLLLDGVHHETVLHAAGRLYPAIQAEPCTLTVLLDDKGRPDHAFNYPTNSSKANKLRADKLHEIDQALRETAKYEKAVMVSTPQNRLSDERESSPEASLLITRPAYMEPRDERYKKQGLTKSDYNKYLQQRQENRLDLSLASPVKPPQVMQERHCHCREVDDGTEMLRCSSELCPIGWFHFKCTGLDQLPTTKQQFFCRYCSDGNDAFVTQDILHDDAELFTGPSTPLPAKVTPIQHLEHEPEQETGPNFDDDIKIWLEDERIGHKFIKWSAVDDSGSSLAVTPLLDVGDENNSSTPPIRPDSDHSPAVEPDDLVIPDDHSTFSIANMMPSRNSTSSLPAPSIFDLIADNDASPQETTEAPATPPLQKARPVTRPWGTPVNLDKLNILDFSSSSPTSKRKRDLVEEYVEGGVRVDGEISDSDERGQEVPLIMDWRTSRDCNR